MKMSTYYIPTLKEEPTEAEVLSHRLMLRAGMLRRLSSGIFSYLPLGLRVIRKVEGIIREEMNRAGALEILMPAVQPGEIWKESSRWDDYGADMLKFRDRRERDFCLGPTHEEVITDLVRYEIRSYKELPVNFYQIQTKFRDEIRPRFGLLRAREFIMKDAYSFNRDDSCLENSYEKMYAAYKRIFERCGLSFRTVEADTGPIGGSESHEFMVIAETGEDEILYCSDCGYAANVERAQARLIPAESQEEPRALEKVATPGVRTIDDLVAFSGYPPQKLFKTLTFACDDRQIIAVVRGNDDLNEIKLKNALQCRDLRLLTPGEVMQLMGTSPGSAGPVGITGIPILVDPLVMQVNNGITGANEEDYHYYHVNPHRDFLPTQVVDLRRVQPGDYCPSCEGVLSSTRGIEVGHLFKLGEKYSLSMEATYLDSQGKKQPFVMGCYGIGVTRTVAAAIEQNHDEQGIIWPRAIAPFQVLLLPLFSRSKTAQEAASHIYQQLLAAGVEVLLDDRDERAGIKFNDADLLGIPLRITLGKRSLEQGLVEIKERASGEETQVQIEQVVEYVTQRIPHLF